MTDESAFAVFAGAYLNQDVFDFYADEFAATDDFVRQDPDLAVQLLGEIRDALGRYPDEVGLKGFLDDLGVEIGPGDITYREWLTQIADRVRAAT